MEKIHPLTLEREQSSPVKTGGFAFLALVMGAIGAIGATMGVGGDEMVGDDGALIVWEAVAVLESI